MSATPYKFHRVKSAFDGELMVVFAPVDERKWPGIDPTRKPKMRNYITQYSAAPPSKSELLARARQMRREPTPAEAVLKRRLRGLGFRSQVVIGKWILDFVCPARMVVIEVDGAHHQWKRSQRNNDHRRDGVLKLNGFVVQRIKNTDAETADLGWITKTSDWRFDFSIVKSVIDLHYADWRRRKMKAAR